MSVVELRVPMLSTPQADVVVHEVFERSGEAREAYAARRRCPTAPSPPRTKVPWGWQERALCAQTDPEAFFPEKGGSTREAKKVCLGCEVRSECLEYALGHDERFGIWGGLSERERRRLKKAAV